MLGTDDLKEYYEMLEKRQAEFNKNRKTSELQPLLDEQVNLIQKLIHNQTKIIATLAGLKV